MTHPARHRQLRAGRLIDGDEVTDAIALIEMQRQYMEKESGLATACNEALRKLPFDALALAHQLDDQAETVLMSLLRGAGPRGASGMQPVSRFSGRRLVRPLLDVSRESILAYAREHALEWIEDESNLSDAFTRTADLAPYTITLLTPEMMLIRWPTCVFARS